MPRIDLKPLRELTVQIFEKLGVPGGNAEITTDVLLASDRRGIASHGLARLGRYVGDIRKGTIDPKAEPQVLKETPATYLVDAKAGLGQVASVKVMRMVMDKAKKTGMASAVIRNSNHYGIAGYTAMMALRENLIGFSVTNTAPLVVPTFGKDAVLGTNPIAIAVPAGRERPFVLDMATSTVPRGKLEVYERLGKKMPATWATDETGRASTDPAKVLKNMIGRKGGGLAPLGGAGEESGGYKGYDLAAVVEILSGGLGIASMLTEIYGKKDAPPDVSHFLAAIDPGAFGNVSEFKARMDSFIGMLKNAPKADGEERIWIAGEKEWEAEKRNRDAVDLDEPTVKKIRDTAAELNLTVTF